MRRFIGPVILLALAAVSLFFLQHRGGHAPAPVPSQSSTVPVAAPTTVPQASAGPAPSSPSLHPSASSAPAPAGADEHDGSALAPSATAAARGPAQTARFKLATTTATAFLTAFARPAGANVDEGKWWATVRSFLTDQAAADYQGIDPSQIPYTRITGRSAVIPTDAPADLLTAVRVPTDAGDYVVELTITERGMQVSRVVPPSAG